MNFVIVTQGFYPLQNAEAYCSTRFASALAEIGHTVHVVTNEYSPKQYENSYKVLVNPNIHVSRIPFPVEYPHCHTINWHWKTVLDENETCIDPYIKTTVNVLRQYDHPILITRTYPWLSLYVGWHCRKYAAKWIQHFSDPMIDFVPSCRLLRLRLWSLKWWMRRAMREADAISVTCKRVRWYYREQLGSSVDKAKFILATHIGDFKFGRPEVLTLDQRRIGAGVIYHDGDIYGGRGLLIVDAVERLNAEGVSCRFIQGRDVKGEADRACLLKSPYCQIAGTGATDEQRTMARYSQVTYVSDFSMQGLAYSGHLMSKFVYQLFTDKPMVVLAKVESEKHDYCVRYPEAGLFFAEMGNVDSLVAAIKAAFACDPATIDRTRIRVAFSEESVAEHFVKEVAALP